MDNGLCHLPTDTQYISIIDVEREKFEKVYLLLRKTDSGEYSSNIGNDARELLTRKGSGYLYGHPNFAWEVWKERARVEFTKEME